MIWPFCVILPLHQNNHFSRINNSMGYVLFVEFLIVLHHFCGAIMIAWSVGEHQIFNKPVSACIVATKSISSVRFDFIGMPLEPIP